jgi:hypothetical protein
MAVSERLTWATQMFQIDSLMNGFEVRSAIKVKQCNYFKMQPTYNKKGEVLRVHN